MRHAIARFLFRVIYIFTGVAPIADSASGEGLVVERWGSLGWLIRLAGLVAVGFIGYAVWLRAITPLRGAYLVLLSALLAVCFCLFLSAMSSEGRLFVESNWGGLGGGLGGWRVSASFTFLLCTIGLFALLVVAAGSEPQSPDLRERYRAAVNVGQKKGVVFERREMLDGRLYLKGSGSQEAINEFWNEVKLTNPFFDDIVADLKVTPAPGAPAAVPPSSSTAPTPGGSAAQKAK